MSIFDILNAKKVPDAEKLAAVAAVVAEARSKYGNADTEIPPREINTVDGMMNFTHLQDDAKVQVLRQEAQAIKIRAIEFGNAVKGANVNKKIEEMLATSGVFTNITTGSSFEYL